MKSKLRSRRLPVTRVRGEAVKKLGQAPSLRQIFQGFRRFGSEPVPFFHSLGVKNATKGVTN
jgi:hypothetical protein